MTDATSNTVGYVAYVRFILRMYRLTKEGKFESAEADGAREEIDGVWNTLSEVEKNRLRGLSLDLKHLLKSDRNSELQPVGGVEKEANVRELRREGRFDEALELLRASQDEILAGSVSTLRALIWSGLGQPRIAGEFLQDAMDLIGARDRSLVQSVSQRVKKAFYDKFGGSLLDIDDQRFEQFVRENVEEVLTSVLSDERRRQERDMHDILQSFQISNDETMVLAAK